MQLLQCTVSLPGGSGQCTSWYALPYCLGAVGSGTPTTHCLTAGGVVGCATPAMHCHTAWGRWAVKLLQCAGPPAGGTESPAKEALAALIAVLLQCNTTLPRGSGQCNSCNGVLRCLGAVGSGTSSMQCHVAQGQLRCPPPPGSVAMHCRSSALEAVTASWAGLPIPPTGGPAHCRSCTACRPQVVWRCIARVPPPTAPGQCDCE